MFGIQSFSLKVLIIIVTGCVLVGIATVGGCGGAGDNNAALAQKNIDEKNDDSMDFRGAQVMPAEIIIATAEGKAIQIGAEKKAWTILAYGIVISLIIGIIMSTIYFKAYLAKSPWEKTRKKK